MRCLLLCALLLLTSTIASAQWAFDLVPDPMDPNGNPQAGFITAQLNGGEKGLVCFTNVDDVISTVACRAVGYEMPVGIAPIFMSRPIPNFDPPLNILLYNIHCDSISMPFPCSYAQNPGPSECGNALYLDCHMGTPIDTDAFDYYFAFTFPTVNAPDPTAFKDRIISALVTFLQNKVGNPTIDSSRIVPGVYTQATEGDNTVYNFNFTISTSGAPPTANLQNAINNDPYNIFGRDMKLSYAIVDGYSGVPPPLVQYSVAIVPSDPKVAYKGYVTVTPQGSTSGTVCSVGITDSAATAMCIAAGFSAPTPQFIPMDGPNPSRLALNVLMRSVNCDYANSIFNDCSFIALSPGTPSPQCQHESDVFVDCYAGGPPPTPAAPAVEWAVVFNITADEATVKEYAGQVVASLTGADSSRVNFISFEASTLRFSILETADVNGPTAEYVNGALAGWQQDALSSYLILTLTPNTTEVYDPILTSYPPDSIYLSGVTHGRLMVQPTSGDAGTTCMINTAQQTDAAALCTYISPFMTNYGAFPKLGGGSGGILMQGSGCPTANFEMCFNYVPGGGMPGCDHTSDFGAICAPNVGPIAFQFQNLNVVNFNLTCGIGFDWQAFVNQIGNYFPIDSSRFNITYSIAGQMYMFFINDNVQTDTPRIFIEYFLMNMDWSTLPETRVNGVSFYRGAPYSPSSGPGGFVPTDLTGWTFELTNIDGAANKGYLSVLPPNVPIKGGVCPEDFTVTDAQAVCRTIRGGVDVPSANVYDDGDPEYRTWPIYISNVNCPNSTDGVGGCAMDLHPEGGAPCGARSGVFLDCTTTEYSTTNFTFVSQREPFDPQVFGQYLSNYLHVSPSRMSIEVLATTSADPLTCYYNVRFNNAAADPSIEALEAAVNSISAADLVNQLQCQELRSTDESPNGPPSSQPSEWAIQLLSHYAPELSGVYGRAQLQPGPFAMYGTICGSGTDEADAKALAQWICSKVGSFNPSARLIPNAHPGRNIIYVGDVKASSSPIGFDYSFSMPLDKMNTCDHLSDVGVLCGVNVRPSYLPLIFRAHYDLGDSSVQDAQSAVSLLASTLSITEDCFNASQFFTSSNDKYLDFSMIDTQLYFGDDNALVLLATGNYTLYLQARITMLEIIRDWIDPSLYTTTTETTTTETTTTSTTTESTSTTTETTMTTTETTSTTAPTTEESTSTAPIITETSNDVPTSTGSTFAPTSTNSPTSTGSTDAPTSTGSTDAPISTGSTDAPTSTGNTFAPTSTGSTFAPTSTGSTFAPTSTGSTFAPTSTGSTFAPTSTGSTDAPTSASHAGITSTTSTAQTTSTTTSTTITVTTTFPASKTVTFETDLTEYNFIYAIRNAAPAGSEMRVQCTVSTLNSSRHTCVVGFKDANAADEIVSKVENHELSGVYSAAVINPSNDNGAGGGSSSMTGIIIGVIVGLVVLGIVVGVIVYLVKKPSATSGRYDADYSPLQLDQPMGDMNIIINNV